MSTSNLPLLLHADFTMAFFSQQSYPTTWCYNAVKDSLVYPVEICQLTFSWEARTWASVEAALQFCSLHRTAGELCPLSSTTMALSLTVCT